MTNRKILKKQRRWKDYRRKRNIIRQQYSEMKNGKRKGLSVAFPESKKYAV